MGECQSICTNDTPEQYTNASNILRINISKNKSQDLSSANDKTMINKIEPLTAPSNVIDNHQTSSLVPKSASVNSTQPSMVAPLWAPVPAPPKLDSTVQKYLKKQKTHMQFSQIQSKIQQHVTKEGYFKNRDTKVVYSGHWNTESVPNGWGKMYFPNGQYYEGQFQDGKGTGKGRYIYVGGKMYEGDIQGFVPHGDGRYVDDEFQFDGEWVNGEHSMGNYTLRDGTHIIVNKDNTGKIIYSPTKKYEGELKELNPHGRGVLQDNGKRYQGQWEDGYMHGEGVHTWPDGFKYTGTYVKGVKQGNGTLEYPESYNNLVYEGEFRNGKPQGKGRFKRLGLVIQEGTFLNGKLIEEPPQGRLTRVDSIVSIGSEISAPASASSRNLPLQSYVQL